MKEIEILVEVYDTIDNIKQSLKNFEHIGLNKVIDTYYYDPLRDTLKPNNNELNHCLRLRQKNNKYSITYKDDVFDGNKWLYSNEYETDIDNIDTLKIIFNRMGLKKLLIIDNEKDTYKHGDYEIVVENVKDLGVFMEVEYCTDAEVDILEIKRQIQEFIDKLNINVSQELNIGKPEMYIRKHNIKL